MKDRLFVWKVDPWFMLPWVGKINYRNEQYLQFVAFRYYFMLRLTTEKP